MPQFRVPKAIYKSASLLADGIRKMRAVHQQFAKRANDPIRTSPQLYLKPLQDIERSLEGAFLTLMHRLEILQDAMLAYTMAIRNNEEDFKAVHKLIESAVETDEVKAPGAPSCGRVR
jgi:hypothetical protein